MDATSRLRLRFDQLLMRAEIPAPCRRADQLATRSYTEGGSSIISMSLHGLITGRPSSCATHWAPSRGATGSNSVAATARARRGALELPWGARGRGGCSARRCVCARVGEARAQRDDESFIAEEVEHWLYAVMPRLRWTIEEQRNVLIVEVHLLPDGPSRGSLAHAPSLSTPATAAGARVRWCAAQVCE